MPYILRGIKHDARNVLDNFEGLSPKQIAWFGSVSYNDALQWLDRFFMANQPTLPNVSPRNKALIRVMFIKHWFPLINLISPLLNPYF